MDTEAFRAAVYSNYDKNSRDFPWRQNTDPWGVFVSEFMLQQTQTGRVVGYWKRWMEKWPSPACLSKAPLEEALREWSGLGYNRRAKHLLESAKVIAEKHGGTVPAEPDKLLELPGVGPYTAGAISCFAYNYPAVFIETNIRSVMLHFFFPGKEGVKDGEIFPLLEETLDRGNPRRWYWALMDYGASLKKLTSNPNRRSAGYARQSQFSGSFRQIRGGIVRALARDGPADAVDLKKRLGVSAGEDDFYRALEILEKESMVAEEGGVYRIKQAQD